MTDPNTLTSLVLRCEQASGPDRELDVAIGFQLANREKLWALSGMNAQRPLFTDDDLRQQVRRAPSEYGLGHRYTSSLDAAMSLAGDRAAECLAEAIARCRKVHGVASIAFQNALPRFIAASALRSLVEGRGK